MTMSPIDKNRPTHEWIEQLRKRFPCEKEIDRVLTRKMHRRAGPPYSPVTLETLVQGTEALIRSQVKGDFQLFDASWLSGGALLWLGSILGLDDFAAMDELAALIPPGADGLIFLPALTGAMAPRWQPQARGCFHGLTPAHGRGHMIRAVLEGCSFAMLDVLRHFADMGVAAESLLLLGGGARSALWAQIRADVAARPVEIPAEIHGAPIGAALLAATAAGRLPDIAATAQALQPNLRHFTPNPQASVAYKSSYRAYRDLFDRLYPAGSSAGSSSEYH